MSALTDFLENKLLDWLFRGQAAGITGASAAAGTGPTTLWVGLFTVTPSDTGGGTEVTTVSTAYARVSVASSMANWNNTQSSGSAVASTGTTGTISNTNPVTFPAPTPSNWGTIVAFGIFDASSAGNLLVWGPLTSSKTVNAGDAAPSFAAGALTFQLDN